jgi:hypothetical protein
VYRTRTNPVVVPIVFEPQVAIDDAIGANGSDSTTSACRRRRLGDVSASRFPSRRIEDSRSPPGIGDSGR